MDEEHCVIAVPNEFARFRIAADKRCYNVFLICPVARPLLRQDVKSRFGFG